ncbi:MAG: hypothetical protein AAGC95_14460, partial [Pseudomonadota bacterium]
KQEGVVVFDIFPRNGASMVLDIAAALDGGPRPKGIYAERGRLDDIFRALTSSDVAAATPKDANTDA